MTLGIHGIKIVLGVKHLGVRVIVMELGLIVGMGSFVVSGLANSSWNHPPMADWRPNGNRPVNPRPGWSSGRPIGGGNIANNHHRPIGGGVRPGSSTSRPGWMSRPGSTTRPGSNNLRPNNSGVVNNNGKWEYVNNRGQRNQRT